MGVGLALKGHKANILAMSALLTATAEEMRKLIGALDKAPMKNKAKVTIGGAAITQLYANHIGADGYGAAAIDAGKIANALFGI